MLVSKLMVTVSAPESYVATAFWTDMRSQLSGSLGKPLWAGGRRRRERVKQVGLQMLGELISYHMSMSRFFLHLKYFR